MSKSSANAEPSMEEILASIRQIISDDDESPEAEQDEAPDQEEPAEEKDAEDAKDEAEDVAAKKDAAEDVVESAGDETISEADLDALFADPEPAEPKKEEEPSGDIDEGFDAVAVDPEPEPEPEPEGDDGDVLDLGALPEAAGEPFDAPEDLDFADPSPAPLPEPEPVVHQALPPAAGLLSQETDSAVSAAFANLANTMLAGDARTLEDLVQDMLRPMLKAWLDENLPTMVEKMVREEIERVARRGPRT